MTTKSKKASRICKEHLTENGYLIQLIQFSEFNKRIGYPWAVHSIAPDGYKTVSDESFDRDKCEQTFSLLTEQQEDQPHEEIRNSVEATN